MKKITLLLLFALTIQVGWGQTKTTKIPFYDEKLTTLKKRTNKKSIDKIDSPVLKEAALEILNGTYPIKERLKNYECYLSPGALAKQLKTSQIGRAHV